MKTILINAFILLSFTLNFLSCSFDQLSPEYSNPHDAKSERYIPAEPYNLRIFAADDSSVALGWSDVSLGEKGFIIERSESAENMFHAVDTTAENITGYLDAFAIKLGAKYTYRVRAMAGTQNSKYSNTAEITVEINRPSGLILQNYKLLPLGLSWTGNSTFKTGFVVQSRITGEETEFKTIGETGKTGKGEYWFELPALDERKIYEFRVLAKTARNTSAPSDPVTVYCGINASSAKQLTASPGARYVGFSPVSNEFFASGQDYYTTPFKIYDADLGGEVRTLIGGTAGAAAYNPAGNLLAVGTSSVVQWQVYSHVTIFDASSGEELKLIGGAGRALDFSPDGRYLAIGAHRTEYDHPKELSLLDMTTYKKIWTISDYNITRVKMSPDGSRIIAVSDESYNDKVLVFNAADGSLIKEIIPGSYAVGDLQVSFRDNIFAFTAHGYTNSEQRIEFWDLNTLTKVRQINVSAASFAFMHKTPDYIAVCTDVVRLFRLSDGMDMGPLYPSAQYRGNTLSFNKDDKYLAAGEYYPVLFTLEKTWRMK